MRRRPPRRMPAGEPRLGSNRRRAGLPLARRRTGSGAPPSHHAPQSSRRPFNLCG
ncbi:hypothetical protein BURPS305_1536 [Burkholderia pseudomallei 305]|nr:hypothetical protein BURPS305_1536 [Burkholderia pseudomallei 305]